MSSSRAGWVIPALFTSTSTWPLVLTASSTASFTDTTETSAETTWTFCSQEGWGCASLTGRTYSFSIFHYVWLARVRWWTGEMFTWPRSLWNNFSNSSFATCSLSCGIKGTSLTHTYHIPLLVSKHVDMYKHAHTHTSFRASSVTAAAFLLMASAASALPIPLLPPVTWNRIRHTLAVTRLLT